MIPIAKPYISECEIQEVVKVLRSGNIAQGEKVKEFERNFAEYIGVKHAIATSNGTTALHTSLMSMGIKPGDEVLVPSFTFFSTASAVSMCGATPIMVDVDENTFNINIRDMEAKVHYNTVGVIGVHLFGQPFGIYPMKKMCERYNLFLIEDCAQAIGSEYRRGLEGGGKCGSFGDAGCFSFYATKNMTTGEGGMITTNSDDIAEFSRKFINHGQSHKYYHKRLGYNYRMTDIQAAIGVGQIRRIGENNATRRTTAQYYDSHIREDISGIIKPKVNDFDKIHTYHQYVLRITPECVLTREEFIEYMKENGIGTAVHYPIPIHMQPMYEYLYYSYLEKFNRSICPISEKICEEVVSIPVHPKLTWDEIKYIVETINSVDKE